MSNDQLKLNGMKSVKMNKNNLLQIVKTNREQHINLYTASYAEYKKDLIKELDNLKQKVEAGEDIEHYIKLDKPQNHTEEYDRTISILNNSVNDFVELDLREYDSYVLDKWNWSASFMNATNTYLSKAK